MTTQDVGARLATHCRACNSPRTWAIQVNGDHGKNLKVVYACPYHLGEVVDDFQRSSGGRQLLITLSP